MPEALRADRVAYQQAMAAAMTRARESMETAKQAMKSQSPLPATGLHMVLSTLAMTFLERLYRFLWRHAKEAA